MLRLPERLRVHLARPFGTLYRGDSFWRARVFEKKLVVTVGDVVTARYLMEAGKAPLAAFVDMKTLRDKEAPSISANMFDEALTVPNPPGFLHLGELVERVRKRIKFHGEKTILVYVRGEEDLIPLSLPFLGFSPRTLVVYGQPSEGVVAYELDDVTVVKTGGVLACMLLSTLSSNEAVTL